MPNGSVLVDRKCATLMGGTPVAVSALSGGRVTDLKLHHDPLLSLSPSPGPGPLGNFDILITSNISEILSPDLIRIYLIALI